MHKQAPQADEVTNFEFAVFHETMAINNGILNLPYNLGIRAESKLNVPINALHSL